VLGLGSELLMVIESGRDVKFGILERGTVDDSTT